MSLEQVFVRCCYYYAVGNPIWYVHHGKICRAANDIIMQAVMEAGLADDDMMQAAS